MTRQVDHHDFAGVTQCANSLHQRGIMTMRRPDARPPFKLRRLPRQLSQVQAEPGRRTRTAETPSNFIVAPAERNRLRLPG
ncbi:MAG: hypothetical protein Q8O08_03345, partial [Methyloversatilis sp.]